MDKAMEAYCNLLRQKPYSPNTQKTYIGYFSDFGTYFRLKDINYIGKDAIKDAKGNKDRLRLLSKNLLSLLLDYCKQYKLEKYLFEGQREKKNSASNVATILKHATLKSGIRKNITPHTLRHSFAHIIT